jgi:predicted HTH transcriptional regulator
MDKDQFIELTQLAKEGRNLEFKRSTPWELSEFKAKIVKSILAFSNVRDGGAIVIGVECQPDQSYRFTGITAEHLATYTEDHLASVVAEYADPYAKFAVDKADVDGNTYLIILVSEFDEIPVICKRDGACNLRKGAFYTRTYRIPESAEVPSQTELREILEMAIDKGLRKYLERQARIGAGFTAPTIVSEDEKFAAQRGDLN